MDFVLVIGGRVAGTVITKLINGLIDYAKDQKKMQLGLKDELKRLDKALPKIQAVVNAVDQGLIKEKNPALEKWLWQLRDVADQADDVMDEMEYNNIKEEMVAKRNKVSKAASNFATFLDRAFHKDPSLKKLKETVKAIDDVASDVGVFYMLVQNLVKNQKNMVKLAINSRETGPSLEVGNYVYGREKDKDIVIKRLLNPEYKAKEMNFAVLPIIGAGGIGKTTLAQLVCNDPVVKKNFPLRMWVCISNNFDVALLTKKLYESAIGQRADADYFASIQTKLEKKLESQKFLIVFDDAWNDNDRRGWEKLMAPMKCAKSGSMILLTTRMETVARSIGPNVMDPVILKGLNEGDMRGLLEEYAFEDKDPNNYKKLVQIGSEIVNKLKGFPLAAKTIGGILRSYLSETHWRSILESELWSLENGPNDIMPTLRLSYQHLPSHLKPCFSFCSIFPQDHIFIKDDLINMWVALGLVPRDFNGAKRPEDVGSEYFEDMLNRSIFSPANPVRNAHLQYPAYTYCSVIGKQFVGGYIMHDLMHNLSTYISQGECFRSDRDKPVSIPTTIRHLYICVGAGYELSNFNLNNIHTLILHFDDYDNPKLNDIDNILKRSKSLRVLAVFALKLSEFPESACDLLHLRYLSLSSFNIKEFPISMSKLYFLETMVCGGFGMEKPSQAAGLVELINLRHLIVSEDFVETIDGISRLTSLHELSCRVAKSSGFKICELKDMIDLRRLSISNVGGISSYEEAVDAKLENKVNLCKLSLQWETDNLDKNVFEHLEPHCNLKELKIRNYMGESLPPWLTRLAFSNLEVLIFESMRTIRRWSPTEQPNNCMQCLRELTIDDCPDLLFLPPLPASLKKLILRGLGLFHLPDLLKDHSSKSGMLASLVSIEISECPNLSSLEIGFLKNPEQFTSLEELVIMNCEELETPPDGFSKYISLKRLDISDCPKIKLSFVHRFSLSSTLQFFRIENYVEDIQAEMRHDDNACESSLQYVSTLQTEEAKLVVFDPFQPLPELELRFSSMRSYMGRWSHDWLTQNLPHLEYLSIDGHPKFNEYYSEKLPEEVNQLIRIICQGEKTSCRDISKIQMVQQIYLVTENIKGIQCLKRLFVVLRPSSWVMPYIPVTLKELRLSNLRLIDLKSLQQSPSSQCRSLPSLVKIEISNCSNLVWSTGLHNQFAAVKELIISNCSCNKMQGFIDFISLERLDISDCPEITQWFEHEVSHPSTLKFLPSTLQFLRIDSYVKDIQKEMGKNDIIYQSSLQLGPTLQTDEAELLVFDHVWGRLDLELRFPDMRNYTGRWLPAWLKDLSTVESLCIDGGISHFSEQPNGMDRLLKVILEGGNFIHLCLEIGYPSDLTVIKQSYLVMQNNKITQRLKKLTVALYSSSFVMPPLSFILKELKLHHLGLMVLPYLYEKSSDSWSLPSLASMEITDCPNLLSLAEGLFQKPQQFAALEKLTILKCEKLRELPQGGFKNFTSLKELHVARCPKIEGQLVPECFLPSALQVLRISNCGDLGATLTKALGSVRYLISLELHGCKNIRSLPPKELFSRWETLEKLQFEKCDELTSLESLLGLSSLKLLIIHEYPKLVSVVTSPSAWNNDEIEGTGEDGTIQTSSKPASTQPTPTDPSSWTNTEHKPLFSVDELEIDNPQLLYIEPIRSLSSVRKLTIEYWLGPQSLSELPTFFFTLKELRLHGLGLIDLPNLCINHSGDSGSLSPLISIEITHCSNLVSLAEIFQKPQQFAALEKLKIRGCKNLRELPQGGFNKFVSLDELIIEHCPKIEGELVPECFLPSALQVLNIFNCGVLDATLTEALESVESLISLQLYKCKNIRSLPPKEVFSRWETLDKLKFEECDELTSLESLLGLSSVRLLTIWGCPKLVSAITSPSAVKKDEIEGMVEESTIQTSNRPASTQPTPTDPCSSTNTEHKPLLSVDELEIDDPLLLSIEPIRSLSSVRKLTITWCLAMQSLPELPPIREELSLYCCGTNSKLKRRCEESGEDWPKLSHIPKVSIYSGCN